MDFRGFDSRIILSLRGWNSQAHGEFPGKFESRNLSRDNLSREIGRSVGRGEGSARRMGRAREGEAGSRPAESQGEGKGGPSVRTPRIEKAGHHKASRTTACIRDIQHQ